ncbi:MAG: hypothetical protein AAF468_03700 [Pseudomonadota bacterium]
MANDLIDQLRGSLAEFDGKAVSLLTETEAMLGSRPGYLDGLIAVAGDREVSVGDGATWLFKSALESGQTLSVGQSEHLIATLPDLKGWAAQLHICQSVRYFSLDETQAEVVAGWLEPLLAHKRPFLRAWSLDAIWCLAKSHDKLRDRADTALSNAENDDAASVRARARNLK